MKKIDGHAHILNTIAGFNGKGRLNALGNGYAIWDDGELIKLIPDGYGDKDFTAEAFLKYMDANDVEKAVILQGHLNGYQNYYTSATQTALQAHFRWIHLLKMPCRLFAVM